MMKKTLLAAMVVASLGGAAIAIPANVEARDVIVRVAPPPPRDEAVPAARRGYVYVPGHWDWQGKRYRWVKGTFVRERQGYRYENPHWIERNGGWVREGGRWDRGDRDHDGVPNRMDNAPNNPRRQ